MDTERDQYLALSLTRHVLQNCPNVIFNNHLPAEDRLHQFMTKLSENINKNSPVSRLSVEHIQNCFDDLLDADSELE